LQRSTREISFILHPAARTGSARIQERLLTSEYVLWETLNFASDTANRAKAAYLVRQLINSQQFEVVNADFDLFTRGLDLYASRIDQTWSLRDCLTLMVMTDRSIGRALTHDHHFEQAGFQALLRMP
jgi:predicted nucleic acid-binding protein